MKAKKPLPYRDNIKYLINRLERVIELINSGDYHMAVAKLLADISALKAMLESDQEK